ncbi:UNVERIFIED_CONTAM: hypothetical protein FKN15_067777 [Acipenser sinensis]
MTTAEDARKLRDWILENAGLEAKSLPIAIRILWMMDSERWEAYQREHTPNNLEEGLELVLSYLEAAISGTAAQVAGPPAEGKCLLSPSPPAEGKCLLSPSPPAEGECLLSRVHQQRVNACWFCLHSPSGRSPSVLRLSGRSPNVLRLSGRSPNVLRLSGGSPNVHSPKGRSRCVHSPKGRSRCVHSPKGREVGACTALGPKLPAEGECLLVPPPPAEEQCLLSPCPPAGEECLLSLCPPLCPV